MRREFLLGDDAVTLDERCDRFAALAGRAEHGRQFGNAGEREFVGDVGGGDVGGVGDARLDEAQRVLGLAELLGRKYWMSIEPPESSFTFSMKGCAALVTV